MKSGSEDVTDSEGPGEIPSRDNRSRAEQHSHPRTKNVPSRLHSPVVLPGVLHVAGVRPNMRKLSRVRSTVGEVVV